jgi:uncharacterized OsmC-like protein
MEEATMATALSMQSAAPMNGVDVDALQSTIAAVAADSSLARFQFRAKNRWLDGGHNRSTIQGFYGAGQEDATRLEPFVLGNAEPPMLLGRDEAANPVEYVLHALIGCLTTTTVYHAAARGIAIEAVSSEIEGDLDLRGFLGLSDKVRKGFHQVRVTMRVKTQADAETLTALSKFSPVYDIVSKSLPVSVRIETY